MLKPVNEIYQLRVWIKGISPMIWRRLLVHCDSSLADLHFYIQLAFGWSDTYLNQFTIYGKSYGVYHEGGISFSDDASYVYLRDFQFRNNDKFLYEYNFFDHWEHEIRVEKSLPAAVKKTYPCCVGGARAAPIEDCGGAHAFMALDAHYSPWHIEEHILESLSRYQQGQLERMELQAIFQTLRYWINCHRFNRHRVNDRLRRFANGEDVDELMMEGLDNEN